MTLSNILPPNEKKEPKETPRNFVIFGGTMEGKTYFSKEFPNPLNLNTDGNADMSETPNNKNSKERGIDCRITKPASEHLAYIITDLETQEHTYDTVVIDVIDDIITLFEQEICEEHGVKSIGDIAWGKGHQLLGMAVRVLVMRLKELSMTRKMNIIYVSRLNIIEENDVEKYVPSLPIKWLNIVNGNSDYMILCRKVGKNYIRRAVDKRKNFDRDLVDDERILNLLDTVSGAFDRSQRTDKKKQEKIVKELEEQEKVQQAIRQRERQQALKGGDEETEKKSEPRVNRDEPKQEQPRPRRRRRRAVTN